MMTKPATCAGCPFFLARDNRFCGPEIPLGKVHTLFIAERPGETELEFGRPLHPTGRSGFHARKAVTEAPRRVVGFTNVLKCAGATDANKEVMQKAVDFCVKAYLGPEMEACQPERVVVMGGLALREVMGLGNPLRFHGSEWTIEEAKALRGVQEVQDDAGADTGEDSGEEREGRGEGGAEAELSGGGLDE